MELCDLTAHELHGRLVRREVSAEEITRSALARVDAVEGEIQSYITLIREMALNQARAVDHQIGRGEKIGPLAGIPAAIKDVFSTEGIETTGASRILKGYYPPYNATVVQRLLAGGMVMIGKTNCDEFAMGLTTENSAYRQTKNPWNTARVPGGSSGGSATAVAAGEAVYSLGTDTGGSIRVPSAYCGLVGLKPSYGRVSRYGVMPLADSLDHVGPFTRDVTDCATVMNVIAGHDALDGTSDDTPVPDYCQSLVSNVRGLKIGIPREFFGEGLEPEVERAVLDGIKRLEELGAVVGEVSLPHSEDALAAYTLVLAAEAASNLGRFDGLRHGHQAARAADLLAMYRLTRDEGFGDEVKRRLLLGTHILSQGNYERYLVKAMQIRTLVIRDFDRAFADYDVLIAPAAPTVALPFGMKPVALFQPYLTRICTVLANLAGVPALALPCGRAEGLPIGLQIMGKPRSEPLLLQTAYTLEQNADFRSTRPPIGRQEGE